MTGLMVHSTSKSFKVLISVLFRGVRYGIIGTEEENAS